MVMKHEIEGGEIMECPSLRICRFSTTNEGYACSSGTFEEALLPW